MNMPFVEVTLVAGRTREQKRALFEAIAIAVETSLEVKRDSIRIVLREVPPEHWAVGGIPKG
jgi:4-oxalocrotonate tautomerase